ncbi:kynurenine 3-monooxygenase-like isoform X2 [Littorina saxatilis]
MPYGKHGQSIISLNRKRLNEEILSAAEEYSNVRTHFNHKLICCNLDKGEVTFLHEGRELKRRADVIIGNDGAYSAVRGMMMKHPDVNMDFQQEYIPHCYMQIDIPANSHGEFAMAENYIHVWPRENLLLVALPNPDRSFTAALFMECQLFHTLRDKDAIVPFFANHLPDALALIGEDSLRKTFMNNIPSRLISIKCNPHHYSSKSVIMGDAAHAMTPFYGQGMNCGFEDCLVLSELLDEYHNDFDKALPAYTERRYKDTHAIVDLAMQNYDVLRSSVNSPVFRFHKKVDRVLHSWFPSTWTDLYIAVAFSRKRYQHCVEACSLQDRIVTGTCILLLFCIVICALFPVCAYCL